MSLLVKTMQASNQPPKSAKGTVGIELDRGRLRLRLPRSWFDGKQKYLALGLEDTPENRAMAETKATQITVDYKLGLFDPSLDKYRNKPVATVTTLPTVSASASLSTLWTQYVEFKTPSVSPSTVRGTFQPVTAKLKKMGPDFGINDALKVRDWLLRHCSADQTKRTLVQINACLNWAVTSGEIAGHNFGSILGTVKLPKSQQSGDFDVHPFTRDERDAIIAAFESNQFVNRFCAKDALHSNYASYVKFLFFTGCRPSEAIGLQWKHIKDDRILFQQSVVDGINGKTTKVGLKTQDFRYFPINAQLRNILDNIKPENVKPDDYVFVSPRGGLIDVGGFRNRVWVKVLEGLDIPYRKPYQTRHTFITLCLENGIDAKDVAKWVGNSPEIIYKHYASAKKELNVPEL